MSDWDPWIDNGKRCASQNFCHNSDPHVQQIISEHAALYQRPIYKMSIQKPGPGVLRGMWIGAMVAGGLITRGLLVWLRGKQRETTSKSSLPRERPGYPPWFLLNSERRILCRVSVPVAFLAQLSTSWHVGDLNPRPLAKMVAYNYARGSTTN